MSGYRCWGEVFNNLTDLPGLKGPDLSDLVDIILSVGGPTFPNPGGRDVDSLPVVIQQRHRAMLTQVFQLVAAIQQRLDAHRDELMSSSDRDIADFVLKGGLSAVEKELRKILHIR